VNKNTHKWKKKEKKERKKRKKEKKRKNEEKKERKTKETEKIKCESMRQKQLPEVQKVAPPSRSAVRCACASWQWLTACV
jgi:hypothetical protein